LKNTRFLILFFLLLACSVVVVGAAFRLDAPIRQEIVKSQGKQWKKSDEQKFHAAVRVYGDWPWLMLYGGICLAVAWKLRNRDWQRILAAAMLASTLAGMIANASRLTTGRTRPNAGSKIEQGFYGPWKDGRVTIGDRVYNSFPSGHTATAFGLAWVIVFARPWLGVGALVLAGLVGYSSIVMGAHHPSDVAVSIFLSLGVAWFTWKWVQENGDQVTRKFSLWWRRRKSQKARAERLKD
jgi:membrane-associated phospholipid phosphatase